MHPYGTCTLKSGPGWCECAPSIASAVQPASSQCQVAVAIDAQAQRVLQGRLQDACLPGSRRAGPADCDESYRLARYVDFDHWKDTRRPARMVGTGPISAGAGITCQARPDAAIRRTMATG